MEGASGAAPGAGAPAAATPSSPPSASPTASSVHASRPLGSKKPKQPVETDKDEETPTVDNKQLMDLDLVGAIQLSETGAPPEWVQVFPEGSYKHPKGRLKFDAAFLSEITDNLNNRVRKIDILVDKDHDRAEANGWGKEARYIPGHGVDVRIDWTKLGVDRVSNRLYRYVSPEFGPYEDAATEQKHRHVLNCISLTNVPYLKNLPEVGLVQLSEAGLFELAESKTATPENKDPDDDGDDDSTKDGDTDKDYTGPDGKRKPKKDASKSSGSAQMFDDNKNEQFFLSVSKAERDAMPAEDFAGPDESFPIGSEKMAHDAWDLAGHAADPDAVRARIRAIAKRKGYSLPASASEGTRKMNEEQTIELADVVRRLGEIEAENKRLRESEAATQRKLAEAEFGAEVRQLSERREVVRTGEDGTETRGMTDGFAPRILDAARTFALNELDADQRVAFITLLKDIQEDGMVPLGELGAGRSSDEHDPVDLPVSKGALSDGADVVKKAEAFALKEFKKPLTALTADERMGVFKLVGYAGEAVRMA